MGHVPPRRVPDHQRLHLASSSFGRPEHGIIADLDLASVLLVPGFDADAAPFLRSIPETVEAGAPAPAPAGAPASPVTFPPQSLVSLSGGGAGMDETGGRWDGPPSVLVDRETGRTRVFWVRRSGDRTELVASSYGEGEWSTPRALPPTQTAGLPLTDSPPDPTPQR